MNDALNINVAGRVMIVLGRVGMTRRRGLAIYVDAVTQAVRYRLGDIDACGYTQTQAVIEEQVTLLEQALRRRAAEALQARTEPTPAAEPDPLVPEDPATDPGPGSAAMAAQVPAVAAPDASQAFAAEPTAAPSAAAAADRPARSGSRCSVPVRTMEEKLKEGREPVQKLLLEDCTAAGLIDADTARRLIAGMTGKTCEDSEIEIVEYLREVVLAQVRRFIRKHRDGPWSSPIAQADLRADIHNARSVRGILTLNRQLVDEHRAWEKANGRDGLLGLFSRRR